MSIIILAEIGPDMARSRSDKHWVLGGVTELVLQATRLPLLIVPPPDVLDTGDQSHEQASMAVLKR